MGNANKDREEKRNLSRDLPQCCLNPRPIPEFDVIPFYYEKLFKILFLN
jgi:hypothetical protein